MAHKLAPVLKKRLGELRAAYRRGRGWHYGETKAMDRVWESALPALAAAKTPDQQRAAVDRLAADLAPFLAGVPADAPPAPSRRKAAA